MHTQESFEAKAKTPLMLRALRGEALERPPVWLMRQAGRYMAEYRALKEKYSFLELCRSPELAVEVSMQPMNAFDMDASIIFADILLPFTPLGLEIDFNPGPQVANKINSPSDIEKLKYIGVAESCSFVGEAISSLKNELSSSFEQTKTLIGFAGAPWTLACYMIDQGPLKNFAGTQVFAARHPEVMLSLLDRLAAVIEEYLLMQIEAGADTVQLFDTWAGLLPIDDYRKFALPATKRIVETVQKAGKPIILYVNSASHLTEAMLETGANCLSLDSCTNLGRVIKQSEGKVALQGNFEATNLFKEPSTVKLEVEAALRSFPRNNGYIFNLGHGVLQRTPTESVKTLVETVKGSKSFWNDKNSLESL